jgi:type I restriction enzyme S subunit
LFNTSAGESLILSKVRGAVTKSITKDAIREILIPVPDIDKQIEFVNIVNKIEFESNQMKEALREHIRSFNAIMNKLFI